MKTSSCKAKCRRLQDAVRGRLLKWAPVLEPEDIKCAIMGEAGTDLHFSPRAKEVIGLGSCECKNQEKLNIWGALKQAKDHSKKHKGRWAVFFKRNNTDIYVVMELEQFLEML